MTRSKFAEENQLSQPLLQKTREEPTGRHLPWCGRRRMPADNDLLIGAYMASGDTAFIERILANFYQRR